MVYKCTLFIEVIVTEKQMQNIITPHNNIIYHGDKTEQWKNAITNCLLQEIDKVIDSEDAADPNGNPYVTYEHIKGGKKVDE